MAPGPTLSSNQRDLSLMTDPTRKPALLLASSLGALSDAEVRVAEDRIGDAPAAAPALAVVAVGAAMDGERDKGDGTVSDECSFSINTEEDDTERRPSMETLSMPLTMDLKVMLSSTASSDSKRTTAAVLEEGAAGGNGGGMSNCDAMSQSTVREESEEGSHPSVSKQASPHVQRKVGTQGRRRPGLGLG